MNSRQQNERRTVDSCPGSRAWIEEPLPLLMSDRNQPASDWASTADRLYLRKPSNRRSVPIHCGSPPARFPAHLSLASVPVRHLFGATPEKRPPSPQIIPPRNLQVVVNRSPHHNRLGTELTYLRFCAKTCPFTPKKSAQPHLKSLRSNCKTTGPSSIGPERRVAVSR